MSPPAPSLVICDLGIDFVLLDLTNDMDEIHAREKVATPVLPLPTETKPDYVLRRIECWNKGCISAEFLDVSTSLPLTSQAAFRRKLLLVLALQLLAVWVVVGLATFYPPVRDRVTPLFVEYNPVLLGVSAAVTFVLLCVLYFQRSRRYVNVLILMWFSAAQAATFVGLGVIFDTHIGFFNCGATFTWVLLMIFLVGVRLKKEEGTYRHLMSPLVAGALSFVAVVCASCILFIIYCTRFVTSGAFGYSLIFQFILLAWFAWDAAWIFQVVAVDEFAYGVIYIYTDIVLSFLFSVAVAGVAVGFASLMVVMLASCGEFDCSCCCECSFNDCSLLIVDTNTRSNAGISAGASRPARAQRHSNTASRTNDIQRDQRNQRMERV